ncbi:MAG: hypothetical protein H7A45_19855 [Verrucomicrobiales bacterium]|nr:hypothetical protein [Verrucomicrobiales bacterium]MCP5527457.1 hypothetical protein [Verrucomicrobiales bacterium]
MRQNLTGLMLALAVLGLSACKSNQSDYFLPSNESVGSMPERGSIADMNERRGAGGAARPGPATPQTMLFLVVHDVEGRPVYVELRRSSGDPQLDQRARHHVITARRFPPGQADTVMLSLDPKEVPRQ